MKNSVDDLLFQCYRAVPHRLIPGFVQARITARITIRNKELEQKIIRLKWQLSAIQTRVIPH
ncbi:hypothetical protein DWZ49_14870 [Ruminococcus sp. AF33-11BH]|jgi:hypothetical protein|nr:hypothetical protein DWZ49_14870 [Ruminococcus sp. AF33-11BH]